MKYPNWEYEVTNILMVTSITKILMVTSIILHNEHKFTVYIMVLRIERNLLRPNYLRHTEIFGKNSGIMQQFHFRIVSCQNPIYTAEETGVLLTVWTLDVPSDTSGLLLSYRVTTWSKVTSHPSQGTGWSFSLSIQSKMWHWNQANVDTTHVTPNGAKTKGYRDTQCATKRSQGQTDTPDYNGTFTLNHTFNKSTARSATIQPPNFPRTKPCYFMTHKPTLYAWPRVFACHWWPSLTNCHPFVTNQRLRLGRPVLKCVPSHQSFSKVHCLDAWEGNRSQHPALYNANSRWVWHTENNNTNIATVAMAIT